MEMAATDATVYLDTNSLQMAIRVQVLLIFSYFAEQIFPIFSKLLYVIIK